VRSFCLQTRVLFLRDGLWLICFRITSLTGLDPQHSTRCSAMTGLVGRVSAGGQMIPYSPSGDFSIP